ncbi:hypothetical protein D3C75_1093780 [compost metagenome]
MLLLAENVGFRLMAREFIEIHGIDMQRDTTSNPFADAIATEVNRLCVLNKYR